MFFPLFKSIYISIVVDFVINSSLHFRRYSFGRLSICVASYRTFSFMPYGVSPIRFVRSFRYFIHLCIFLVFLVIFVLELSHWDGTDYISRTASILWCSSMK